MRSKKLVSVILLLLVVCLISVVRSAFAQVKPFELSYSVVQPATHPNGVLASEWAREIEKRTNGRIKFTLYYSGTLTSADKIYNGVVSGISDVGQSVLAYTRGKFPLMEVIDLPLGYKTGYIATKLANDFYGKFKPKELDGVKIMYLYCVGPGILLTGKTPVRTLEDIRGKKIRCSGLAAKVVTALGGAPVAMPMGDTYDALSKGIVEGMMGPVEVLDGYRLADVIKFVTENHGSAFTLGMFVVMNEDKWKALPPDIQAVVAKVNEEWIEKNGKLVDESDKLGRNVGLKKGIQFIRLPKEEDQRWAKAVTPLFDDYVNSMKAKGLPGKEALDFCLDWLKRNQQ